REPAAVPGGPSLPATDGAEGDRPVRGGAAARAVNGPAPGGGLHDDAEPAATADPPAAEHEGGLRHLTPVQGTDGNSEIFRAGCAESTFYSSQLPDFFRRFGRCTDRAVRDHLVNVVGIANHGPPGTGGGGLGGSSRAMADALRRAVVVTGRIGPAPHRGRIELGGPPGTNQLGRGSGGGTA